VPLRPKRGHQLVVRRAGYATIRHAFETGSTDDVVRIEATRGASVVLQVVGCATPARLRVRDASGEEIVGQPRWVVPGPLTLGDLPAGTVRVEITTRDGSRTGAASLHAIAGETTHASIELK
jgi:hypothetical protein